MGYQIGEPTMLDELAIRFKTDKSSDLHNYTRYYEKYFSHLKNEKIKLLEIGVQAGNSIQMWNEFFINAKTIVGLDIDTSKSKHLENEKIKIVEGSQTDLQVLKNVNDEHGPFDIVIDDGGHQNHMMITSFEYLFPLLKNDGCYVVEDLHCCYWKNIIGFDCGEGQRFTDYLKDLIDDVNGRGKHCLADRDKYHIAKERRWPDKNLEGLEKMVDSIMIHKSICFINKHEIGDIP